MHKDFPSPILCNLRPSFTIMLGHGWLPIPAGLGASGCFWPTAAEEEAAATEAPVEDTITAEAAKEEMTAEEEAEEEEEEEAEE